MYLLFCHLTSLSPVKPCEREHGERHRSLQQMMGEGRCGRCGESWRNLQEKCLSGDDCRGKTEWTGEESRQPQKGQKEGERKVTNGKEREHQSHHRCRHRPFCHCHHPSFSRPALSHNMFLCLCLCILRWKLNDLSLILLKEQMGRKSRTGEES